MESVLGVSLLSPIIEMIGTLWEFYAYEYFSFIAFKLTIHNFICHNLKM